MDSCTGFSVAILGEPSLGKGSSGDDLVCHYFFFFTFVLFGNIFLLICLFSEELFVTYVISHKRRNKIKICGIRIILNSEILKF